MNRIKVPMTRDYWSKGPKTGDQARARDRPGGVIPKKGNVDLRTVVPGLLCASVLLRRQAPVHSISFSDDPGDALCPLRSVS